MSPGVLRVIFGGFALVLVGLAVNTLLLQPDVAPPLAMTGQPVAKTVATAPASLPPVTRLPTLPARADKAPDTTTPAKEPIRVAHLATDSTHPSRMPRLPEIEGDPDVILRVQKELLSRGYGPVVANGIIGPLSRAAIMAYEYDHDLPISGEATENLLKRMREGTLTTRQPSADARKIRSPDAEQVVRTVQYMLTSLGYEPGRIDGRVGDETERAIRAFETAHKLRPTGRVSAELFSLLARGMGARSAKATP
jgi:hypothetical protein